MICQDCGGKRLVPDWSRIGPNMPRSAWPTIVCESCLGGEQHCCEGEQCQPDNVDKSNA